MNWALVIPIVASMITALTGATVALRQAGVAARNTRRLEAKKVDAEAYERARASYEASIAQLEKQNTRQEAQIQRQDVLIADLQSKFDACQDAFRLERVQVNQLRSRVQELEFQLSKGEGHE